MSALLSPRILASKALTKRSLVARRTIHTAISAARSPGWPVDELKGHHLKVNFVGPFGIPSEPGNHLTGCPVG